MSRPVVIFLTGLIVMATVASLLVPGLTSGRGEGARPAAYAAIWLGVATIAWGYFQLRRSLDCGNLEFLKAFFGGLALRFGLLAIAGLAVHFATNWNSEVFLVSLALTYPLFLAFEAWRISGEQPRTRGSEERPSQTR